MLSVGLETHRQPECVTTRGARTYTWRGDYNVLYLTADAEVTHHLDLLVCVHIQEPEGVSGRTLSSHVDPPALHLLLFCRFPARGSSEDTWKEAFQDLPCVMGPTGLSR